MKSTQTQAIDLKKFCASEDVSRYSLTEPFTRGEFTYATDGHIIVRVPVAPDIPLGKNAPNLEELPWDAVVTDDQWLKIDHLTFETVDCEDCHGGNEFPHDCPDCECDCESCDNGQVFKERSVKIGSKLANPKFLKLLQSLPGALLAPDATPKNNSIPFKFDGGQGLLMPMRDE